ncbi:MAG: hypothetical protein IJ637_00535, partial [Prevotella sp.]|nr:hypothetical protein [Prevotella sp.]
MKQRLLTIKTLLVAGLLSLGASGAWADDYYNVTRYSQDYEDATTYADGWVFGGGDHKQASNGSNYLQMSLNRNKSTVTNTLSFVSNTYFTGATDYQFSFDFGYGSGNANQKPTSLTVKGKGGATLFMFKNSADEAWGNDFVLTDGAGTELGKYVATYKTISNPFLNISVIGNSTDGVKLTVNNNGTKIADAVKVADFTTIESIELVVTGGASVYGFDNMILKEHSDVAVAEDPTFAFKSVSGDNRVYTITNPNGEGILYYTTVTADAAPAVGDAAYSSTTEASIDVPFATGTYYAYAVLGDGTTTSGVVSQAVSGGAIQLVKPTFTIVSYNEATAKTTITLNTNVSGILGTPAATIKYTIDEGAEQSTTNGGSVEVADGSTISFYAEADGYTTSETAEAKATAPNANPVLWSEKYNGIVSVNSDFSLGSEVSDVNGTKYYYLYYSNGATLVEKVLANNVGSNYMLRANGLYPGGSWNIALSDMEVGDYITINGITGNAAFEISGNSTDLTADDWHTISGSKYTFTVKKAGTVRFTMARYGYIQSITVQRALPANVSAEVGPAGFATFVAPYALDFSGVTGLTAYTATLAGTTVTLTKVDNVPAGTGVVLKGDATTYTVPVIASSATEKGDLKSSATDLTYSEEAANDYYML